MSTSYGSGRRQFIQLIGAGTVAGVGTLPLAANARVSSADQLKKELTSSGSTQPARHHFEMAATERKIDVTPDFSTKVFAYNGQVPGPLIHVQQGDTVQVVLHNPTDDLHSIHWHGTPQTHSWRSDGVPGVTEPGVSSGATGTYEFVADKPGTLWYHCHQGVPNHVGVRGMWGPMIVDPNDPLPIEREVTIDAILMFSGWNPTVADDYFALQQPMEGITYFSINGKSFPYTQPLRVRKGDVLRLRLMPVSVDVAFHLHGHDMLVTHQDGRPLHNPELVDVVHVAHGQRKDVIVHMNNPGRWAAHDHNEHHLSNDGETPGGLFFVVEYEEVEHDPWYYWARKEYDPDFYFQESLRKPHGLIEQKNFRGRRF